MSKTNTNFSNENKVFTGEVVKKRRTPLRQSSSNFQSKPSVYFMASNSYKNILMGHINNRWGTRPSLPNESSYLKVNVGDYIVVYLSITGGESKEHQGFHLVGRVKSKSDSSTIDYDTWGEPYSCITEMDWLNTPSSKKIVSLSTTQELVPFDKWRYSLLSGQWTPVDKEKGWDADSESFLFLLSRLKYGFDKSECVSVPKEYISKLTELNIPYLV
jgi:hypothetical protein